MCVYSGPCAWEEVLWCGILRHPNIGRWTEIQNSTISSKGWGKGKGKHNLRKYTWKWYVCNRTSIYLLIPLTIIVIHSEKMGFFSNIPISFTKMPQVFPFSVTSYLSVCLSVCKIPCMWKCLPTKVSNLLICLFVVKASCHHVHWCMSIIIIAYVIVLLLITFQAASAFSSYPTLWGTCPILVWLVWNVVE